jgi:hypothetical protein
VPVRPVKGQVLRLRDPRGERPDPSLVERTIRGEQAYLVPRGDGRYVLGATMEERGWDTAPTAGGAYELIRDMSEIVPGVLELEIEELEGGPAPGHARQPARDRRRRAGGSRVGDRPSPQRDPPHARNGGARRGGGCWRARARMGRRGRSAALRRRGSRRGRRRAERGV